MAEKLRFNKTVVQDLTPAPDGKRRWVYDTQTPGLAVQITAKGTKSFYLYRWVNGRPEKLRLGRFPATTVEQARREAAKALGMIAEGQNPVEVRRQAKAEMTLEQLHQLWMKHAKVHKRTWPEDDRNYNSFLKPWANRKLSGIKRERVKALHSKVGQNNGHYAANRLLALLSAMFNHAIREYELPLPNPCIGIKKFPEQKREAWIKPGDMPAFFRALEAEHNTDFRDFFSLLLLTGARKGNVLAMRWADINMEQALWSIPAADHKTNRIQTIPLSKPAMAILERRKEALEDRTDSDDEEENKNVYVFPGNGRTGHLTEPEGAWKRITENANLPGLRLHDLRHTMASWQVTSGVSLVITSKALGHTNTSTTARYAHLATDPVRDANEKAAAAMLKAANADNRETEAEDTQQDNQER